MERKTELWIIGGFVALIVIVVALAAFSSGVGPGAPSFNATHTSAITSNDWKRGDANANVSVIEYGDFQCPACGAYEPLVEQLESQYGNRVLFVFRNFPLPQHQDAMIASQAAEAAGLQGKYWEMHDLLYKTQNDWSQEPASTVVSKFFNGYAQSIGLNVAKFDTDINSAQVKQKIQNDMSSANAASVDHTPTFFINLVQIPNPTSLQQFQQAIDAALASSTAASTTPSAK